MVLPALQLGAAVVFPAADTVLDGAAFATPMHIGSPHHECATYHDHLYCQVVRSMATQAGSARVADHGSSSSTATRAPITGTRQWGQGRALIVESAGPRAPPLT